MAPLYPGSLPDLKEDYDPNDSSRNQSLASNLNQTNEEVDAMGAELGTNPRSAAEVDPASTASDVATLLGQFKKAFRQILGTTHWYDAVPETITAIAAWITSPTADAIGEVTSAHGVTIDGLNIKDSALNTNGSVSSSNLSDTLLSGWINAGETWTYASATTFTISGDKTAKYNVGDKIKLTQTTVKYFYIVSASFSSSTTTVTVTGGSDYSLANAAITANYYAKSASPNGFPKGFATGAATTGWAATPTVTAFFSIQGRQVYYNVSVAGTSNATSAKAALPITAVNGAGGACNVSTDNGSNITTATRWAIDTAGDASNVQFFSNMVLGTWTSSGTKNIAALVIYLI